MSNAGRFFAGGEVAEEGVGGGDEGDESADEEDFRHQSAVADYAADKGSAADAEVEDTGIDAHRDG